MILQRLTLLCAIVFSTTLINAQGILPAGPETSSFIKNVNIPMGYVSGAPIVSIPIYTAKSGSIEVPVSLSYNTSGIRVEETATWVGLGWNLNTGGQITRSVRGKPDEMPDYGFINVPNIYKIRYVDSLLSLYGNGCTPFSGHPDYGQTHDTNCLKIAHVNTTEEIPFDFESDLFSFSIMGYSGEFYYNQDSAKFISVPRQNIKIDGFPYGDDFVMTLPDGTKAYFGSHVNAREKWLSGINYKIINGYQEASTDIQNIPHTVSWYISKIEDPQGRSINFNYLQENLLSFGRGTESLQEDNSEPNINWIDNVSFFKQFILKPVISQISSENGTIYFCRSTNRRLDLPNYSGGSFPLDTIQIKGPANTELMSFYFRYGYYTSPALPTNFTPLEVYAEEARKRLYLKSVTQKTGNDSLPPYEFTYNETELPSRLSTAQDYWGYHNGKTNGFKLMPKIMTGGLSFWNIVNGSPNIIIDTFPAYENFINSNSSDRRLDTNFNQSRILTKLKYPTGGSTQYYYETNDVQTELNLRVKDGSGIPPADMVDRHEILSPLYTFIPADPPYPVYFSKTFEVIIPSTTVKIIPQLPTCTQLNDPIGCLITVKVRRLPDMSIVTTLTNTSTVYITLETGQYLLEVLINHSTDNYPLAFQVDLKWGERTNANKYRVGGLRAKKIISSDGLGNTISRSFKYENEETGISSGMLEGLPTFLSFSYERIAKNGNGMYKHTRFLSNSVIPLTDAGRTVRYLQLTEFLDTLKSSFKTNYQFTDCITDSRLYQVKRSSAPLSSWKWQAGQLKTKSIFEKTADGLYRILSKEDNFFNAYEPVTALAGLADGHGFNAYHIPTEYFLPVSKYDTVYAYPNGVQAKLSSYTNTFYNSKYLPSRIESKSTKGENVIQNNYYPFNYNTVSGFSFSTLNTNHVLNLPVKQEASINGKIQWSNVIKHNSKGLPIEIYALDKAIMPDTVAHNPNLVLAAHHLLNNSFWYNANDDIKQTLNIQSGKQTYIWQYQADVVSGKQVNTYPVAVVSNADSSEVAYSSFENGSDYFPWYSTATAINDNGSPMGKRCLQLSGQSISISLVSSKEYVLSYWSNNGPFTVTGNPVATISNTANANGWKCYQYKITGTSNLVITGTGKLDELRLYPNKNAQMTSFHFNYPIGLTSQCSPTNDIVYYEYDTQNRLSQVKDNMGRIIKKICYDYSGQVINCGYGTLANWVAFSSVCQQVSGVNTGSMIVNEKDLNPQSSTFNQTRTTIITGATNCPTCNSESCVGLDKKCINNICETGTRVNTSSVRLTSTTWRCYYHYVWSDQSTSATYYEVVGFGGCLIN